MGKFVTKKEYYHIKEQLKLKEKKVVLCHGVFDLVHPGHIMHFEQAKQMGDILVVSITSSKYVRKGPGRPYFDDELRVKFLEAIQYIDYVMLSDGTTVDDIVEVVEPDIYVKGEEYREAYNDITGAIVKEQKLVESHGGKIAFTSGQKYSSTKLINNALHGLPEEVKHYINDFGRRYSIDNIRFYCERMESLNVLVIGETIIDRYVYCLIEGVLKKDGVYSARTKNIEDYWGGALATARHIANFVNNVTYMSAIKEDEELISKIKEEVSNKVKLDFVYSKMNPTIINQYFLTRNEKREEYRKVFAINNLPDMPVYGEETGKMLFQKLDVEIENYDLVVVCDYGYGLIDENLVDILQHRTKCLAVKCYTDASNMRLNLITKYNKVSCFLLDESELNYIYAEYYENEKEKLRKLKDRLHAVGWLTRGSSGAYGIDILDIYDCPALTLTVKDTLGAENAFFAIASLFVAVGASVELGTFMGNVGGALGANIVGNMKPIEKVDVLKFASTLLNI